MRFIAVDRLHIDVTGFSICGKIEKSKVMRRTIKELSFNFSLDIIQLYLKLQKAREYVLSKQLLKAATSIGANVEEANAAQTKKDFTMKMSIASKEARETKYWLLLLSRGGIVNLDLSEYLAKIEDLINLLTKIVKTSQQSLR